MQNYIHDDETIRHTPSGTSYSSGDAVVIGTLLGVAIDDIADGEQGAVMIRGVVELSKVSAAVIAAGETITWDVSAGAADDDAATPAAGDLTGGCVAVEAAGNGATKVKVALNVGVNTVT